MIRGADGDVYFDVKTDEQTDLLRSLMDETESGKKAVLKGIDFFSSKEGEKFRDALYDAIETLFVIENEHISVRQAEVALRNLLLAGEIHSEDEEVEDDILEAPIEDTTLRDKNGKPLTAQQLKWQEFRQFAEQASMAEVNLRKKSDPEFANFVRKNLEREMQQPVGDSVENLNANRIAQTSGVPSDVRAFAVRYRTMSAADVKKELSPGMNPLGPAAAKEANRLFEAACADGLI